MAVAAHVVNADDNANDDANEGEVGKLSVEILYESLSSPEVPRGLNKSPWDSQRTRKSSSLSDQIFWDSIQQAYLIHQKKKKSL